jgi:hypothetical protein
MIRIFALMFASITMAAAADVAGKWNVTATTSSGREYKLELELKNEGGKLTGTMASSEGSIALEDVQLNGDQLSYKLPAGAGYAVKFTVAGDSMKGTFSGGDGATGQTTAVRAGAAASGGIAGKWKMSANSSGGRQYDVQLDLAQEGGKITGTASVPDGSAPIEEAKLDGDQLTFKISNGEGVYSLKLTVAGNAMKGSYTGPNNETGKVNANR